MRLIDFTVQNYRSITKAYKIRLQNLTVLIGKNNEGKSNLLMALNIAMQTIIYHCRYKARIYTPARNRRSCDYDWDRDFPVQFKQRKNGLLSIFKLNFRLENDECTEFYRETGIRGNEDISIVIKFSKDNDPDITVPKRGTSSYNNKSKEIAEFISKRIYFNYIQAVRTDKMALDVLNDIIISELYILNKDSNYIEAWERIISMQQEVLNRIASQLIEPMSVFLPQIKDIKISMQKDDHYNRYMHSNIDVIIDDGTPTSISSKGDGIKSLVALAMLKDRSVNLGASIIAIEEPESHLHSGAIHNLIDVLNNIADNNQVIITSHNPLFVQQNSLKSNILVSEGTARTAKSISEIREILGVMPSDNLQNANNVFVVEGDEDKVALNKILSNLSEKISCALKSNNLVIKPLNGAGNLSHDLNDLRTCMCNYFVLMDNDDAGRQAIEKAINNNLLKESQYKYTTCPGSKDSEFEDCLKKDIYEDIIRSEFGVDINAKGFRTREKWSDRMRDTFVFYGKSWDDTIEKKVKYLVADAIPEKIDNLSDVLIEQKSGFIDGIVLSLEKMIDNK